MKQLNYRVIVPIPQVACPPCPACGGPARAIPESALEKLLPTSVLITEVNFLPNKYPFEILDKKAHFRIINASIHEKTLPLSTKQQQFEHYLH